jgi:hypothetical protein
MLSDNQIGPQGAQYIAEVLQQKTVRENVYYSFLY